MTATVICINTKIPGRVHYMVRLVALEKRFVLHANITLRRHGYAPPTADVCFYFYFSKNHGNNGQVPNTACAR